MTAPPPRHSAPPRRPAILSQLARPRVRFFTSLAAIAAIVAFWASFILSGDAGTTAPADALGSDVPGEDAEVNDVEDPTVTVATPCTVGPYTSGTVSYEGGPVLERWNTNAASLLAPNCPAAQTMSSTGLLVSDIAVGGGCVILDLESVTFCLDLGQDNEVSRLSVNVAGSDPDVLAAARKLLATALDPGGLRRGGLTRAWPNDSDRLCTSRDSGQLKWSEFQHPELLELTTLIIEQC